MNGDVGMGCFEGMYEDEGVELTPEWIVRVGRPEDPAYQYVRRDDSVQQSLTSDVREAEVFRDEKDAWRNAMKWTFGHGHDRNNVLRCETGYLLVIQGGYIGEELYCEVQCDDYDHWRRLPAAVSFQDQLLGKSGWNSDRQRAYYKVNILLAQGK